jgi:hypothetical protein
MPENSPLTDADYALIQRLLGEHDIDAADPERLERLVLAMWWHREAEPAGYRGGRKYGSPVEDWTILHLVSRHLAMQKERGVARPSIRRAAISLSKKLPFKVWGMSAETIRKRHAKMLHMLRRGKDLPPEVVSIQQKYIDMMVGDLGLTGPGGLEIEE